MDGWTDGQTDGRTTDDERWKTDDGQRTTDDDNDDNDDNNDNNDNNNNDNNDNNDNDDSDHTVTAFWHHGVRSSKGRAANGNSHFRSLPS